MVQFQDSKGDNWGVVITLGDTRRVARACGIDLLNDAQYQTLLGSIGARIEYLYCLLRPECEKRGIGSLDEFDALLCADEETCHAASFALQEAIVNFYRSRGMTALATLNEEALQQMREVREVMKSKGPQIEQALKQQFKVGAASSRRRLERELTGKTSASES